MNRRQIHTIELFFVILVTLSTIVGAGDKSLTLWYLQPAEKWTEALPLGNGRLGCTEFGGAGNVKIQFNVDSLWTGNENPDGKYDDTGMGAYQNFGELLIEMGDEMAAASVMCVSGQKAYYESENIQQSIDGDAKTKWCVEPKGKPVVWQMAMGKGGETVVDSYSFTSANDSPGRDPQNWVMEASSDGEKWVKLDSRIGESAFEKRNQKQSYSFDNDKVYGFYRLTFEPNENVQRLQLAEIELGSVSYDDKGETGGGQFRRELDLSTAVHTVRYNSGGTNFTRQTFCSAPDEVIVVRLTADKLGQYNGSVLLKGTHQEKSAATKDQIRFAGEFDNGLKYEAKAKVINEGGRLNTAGDKVVFEGCDSLTILLAAETNYIMDYSKGWFGEGPNGKVIFQINAAKRKSFEELLDSHVADHQSLFGRVSLEVGETSKKLLALPIDERIEACKSDSVDPDLEELLFQYGRYLLVGSSREGTLPANLQGLWNNSNRPPWHSDYHSNINLQMNYWLAEPANLSECHLPLIGLIEESIEPCRKATKASFGDVRGFTFRTSHNIYGGNGWQWNIPASAWYCQHIWEHYAFTGDKEYLRETAYPILKEVCQFWEDHLKELPNGKLVAPNGWSPEHGPREDGVAHDQQIIWDLFTNYIEAADVLGIDKSYRERIADMRERLDGPRIGKWGQLQEWIEDRDDPKDQHRHTSHLFAVYPGRQISIAKTPKLAKAAAISLKARGESGDSRRSWTWPWRCALWARLQQGEQSHRMIKGLLKYNMLDNFITTHPPLQLDGSFGITAGMCEMLVQSHAGEIHLLPAIPTAWTDGSVKGLVARGGYEVDITWADGKLTKATIHSMQGNDCIIRYGEKTLQLKTKKGRDYELDGELGS